MKNLDIQKQIEESHPDPQPNINHLKRRQSSIRREIIVEGEFCELRKHSTRMLMKQSNANFLHASNDKFNLATLYLDFKLKWHKNW